MKKIVTLMFLGLSMLASAKNYYVKSDGKDTYSGLSEALAWQTISMVNSSSPLFLPGDSILFRKGDSFVGTLTITKSGSVSNPIVIGAYGTGADPIITGFTTITGWSNDGGGIYHKSVNCEDDLGILSAYNTFLVTVDGVNTARGRYPNTGWLTYESSTYGASSTITDNELSGTPNWTGAEAVIRKVHWMTDRNVITNHVNSTLTYNIGSNWSQNNLYGYYIQNDIRTLDALGEWYYNGTNLYMYFGAVDPANKTVKMATRNNLVLNEGFNHQTYDHICLSGSNIAGFYLKSPTNIIIQNCNIEFVGTYGIYTSQNSLNASVIVNNNIIKDCNSTAIELKGTNNYGWIKNNQISNIGLLQGSCAQQASDNWGDGIAVIADNSIVEFNSVTNVGHSGIRLAYGNGIIVRNNFINGFGLTRYDAGGIYSWNKEDGSVIPTGQKIQNNIVLNSNMISSGIGGKTNLLLWGIYLDVFSINMEITGNTASNCKTAGFFIYASANIKASGNTFYNNIDYQMHYVYFGAGDGWPITGCNIENNIFFAKESSQYVLNYFTPLTTDIRKFGAADNNYYVRPIDDSLTFRTEVDYNPKPLTLSDWQVLSGQDLNSFKSPITINSTTDIRFEYNASNKIKVIALDKPMIDIKGGKYSKSIKLLPYTSAILIVDPNPSSKTPKQTNITIYPNPVQKNFSLIIEDSGTEPDLIKIFDSSGRIVFEDSLKLGIENIQIPSNLITGIYLIEFLSAGLIIDVQKLIIDRSQK